MWYPEQSNLCLVWDDEEIRSIGLPDHHQKVTLFVVSSMLELRWIRWIEEKIPKYWESEAPTVETINAIDYSRSLELFDNACKVFVIPMELRHVWGLIRFVSWFRATLTSCLFTPSKNHMKNTRKSTVRKSTVLAEIGPEAFQRLLLTHRNGITTGWKRVDRVLRDKTKARETILKENPAKNVSLSLHYSFCLNIESKVKSLSNQTRRLQEQREWIRAYGQLKAWRRSRSVLAIRRT